MSTHRHRTIVEACEGCLDRYGDTYLGVGWTKRLEDVETRYQVMLDVIDPAASGPMSLLDFGCGASHLYEYILRRGLTHIRYSGLDLSERFLDLSRRKFPSVHYYATDVLAGDAVLPDFDYVLLNGVFNSKCSLTFDEMFAYFQDLLLTVFAKVKVGMAFNVMSKQVDWERDDLFHLPLDTLASFLASRISRHFVIRHDYGLYEYTTYVYRHPKT
jgi:SAM-dependent methyltransferase